MVPTQAPIRKSPKTLALGAMSFAVRRLEAWFGGYCFDGPFPEPEDRAMKISPRLSRPLETYGKPFSTNPRPVWWHWTGRNVWNNLNAVNPQCNSL